MTGIENIDHQIARYQQDISTQQESLKKWLMTEKQGEAVVAVIYTRGFRDTAHDLETRADQITAPLLARHMGTYIKSFTRVIDNVLTVDFIRAIEEGTAKWNREEPFLVVLTKGNWGTTYLRMKRYELYPFQAPQTGKVAPVADDPKTKVAIITSPEDLGSFLTQNGYSGNNYQLGRGEVMIRETALGNRQAEAGLREQLMSFRERINYLQEKIISARSDRVFQQPRLKEKQALLDKMQTDLQILSLKKDSAEMAFQGAQTALYEKKRIHESIIIKTSLVTTKRSQTPAEASAEAIVDKLEEVRSDAKMQHSSSTTDVADFQVVGESSSQAVTEAKIIAVRLISFINEGDSVRVKMAFRVRTALGETATGKGPDWEIYASPSSKPPSPELASKGPISPPDAKTEVSPPPAVAREKPPQAPPIYSKAIAAAEALEFFYELMELKMNGEDLTVFVEATNKSGGTRYLAFYDGDSRYTKSSLVDEAGNPHDVHQVFLWQGDQKTPAIEAFRGIPIESGKSVTIELIFKKVPLDIKKLKLLNLHPYTGVRLFFYRWSSADLPFPDILVRR